MDVLSAVKKLNSLEDEANKIENWVAELSFGDKDKRKPINGLYWFRIEKAIKGVMYEIMEEHMVLEEKIKRETADIEIS